MTQFIKLGPSRSQLMNEMIGQSLGEGLGKFATNYFANKSLENVLNREDFIKGSDSERSEKLLTALQPYGEIGQGILQQRLGIEQQRMQDNEKQALADILAGKEVSANKLKNLSPQTQLKAAELQQKKTMGKNVYDSLIKAGYPEETARLWQQQTEGSTVQGLSDTIKNVNDLLRRSSIGKGFQGENNSTPTISQVTVPGVENQTFDLDFPELPEPINMTSADLVNQNKEREKVNVPIYTETINRLNALDDELRDISHLQELEETENLPSGLEKWNVDWDTGDLRVKALATPEAQDYVKTIARMARKAKEFFPGRVTNFDLEQFKAGFATLANSAEGRRIINQQLALANRIAYLKDEILKAAYDHYGSGADPIKVQNYATKNFRKYKDMLENQLKQVNRQADNLIQAQQQPKEEKKEPQTLDDLFP